MIPPRDPKEAHTDSARSYDLAIATMREREIRLGNIKPLPTNADECRWAQEGPLVDVIRTVRRRV